MTGKSGIATKPLQSRREHEEKECRDRLSRRTQNTHVIESPQAAAAWCRPPWAARAMAGEEHSVHVLHRAHSAIAGLVCPETESIRHSHKSNRFYLLRKDGRNKVVDNIEHDHS